MSGHSKWANIKHKKGKADAQRGNAFTKIGREIAIAVREGGADPAVNGKLRDVIAKARAINMPNDNITRSIKKAAGDSDNVILEEITYEGYLPGGIAVIAEVVTDNRNRTGSEVRHILEKHGGSLGTTGSVGYMFDFKGLLLIERSAGITEDELMMHALEAGAEDVQVSEEGFEVYTAPNDFSSVRESLEAKGYAFLTAERRKIPQTTISIEDEETLVKVLKIIDLLEENDDVMEVFHNAELPEVEEDE